MKFNNLIMILKVMGGDNSVELLSTFQLFYHNHGRSQVTNGLLIVPDGEVTEGEKKINLKNLYEMFKYTK